MMVLALGPTVWIAVGDADVGAIVDGVARPVGLLPSRDEPPREMPAPAPLAMPLQRF